MTLSSRLKTTTAGVSRWVVGAALGVGLCAALATGFPSQALAQSATPAVPAAVAAVPPATGAGPALWVVKDADSTLYLFGTVHVLRPDTAWGSAKVDAALDRSDNVIFEISNPDDQAAIMPLIQSQGISPDRPLSSLLTPAEIADLDEAAKAIGATAAQMDPLRPWLAALSIAMAPLEKAGYDPKSGVELVLKARAVAAGKPVTGLETLDKQVGILAGLSEETQLAFLRSALEDYENAATELDRLVVAWANGDVAALEDIAVNEMREASDEIYQALLVKRNADWANQIQTLLAGSGTTFIAVGAAHLAGDDSVQEILGDRGVTVTRE
jgi:hypothetical protein